MAGPRVTEVSLALYAVIARTGAICPFQEVLSLARNSLRGLGAPTCAASAFGLHTGMYLMNVYSIFEVLGEDAFILPGGSRWEGLKYSL